MSSQTKVELLKSSREILKAKRYSISDSLYSISVALQGYEEGETDVDTISSTLEEVVNLVQTIQQELGNQPLEELHALTYSMFEDLEDEDDEDE